MKTKKKKRGEIQLSNVPIIKEFPDVFPNELTRIPPERKLEVVIDMLSDTSPIAQSPYRMTPAELTELKVQLQESLDKGLTSPSNSLWGVLVLLVKKKDGTFKLYIIYR